MNELELLIGQENAILLRENSDLVKSNLSTWIKAKMKEAKEEPFDKAAAVAMFDHVKETYKQVMKNHNGMRKSEDMFEAFRKKYRKEWKEILPTLEEAIIEQGKYNTFRIMNNIFVPHPKMFKTWLNDKGWTYEIPEYKSQIKKTASW